MKKDYSNIKLWYASICLPNLLSFIFSLIVSLPFVLHFNNIIFLVIFHAFVGLDIGGFLLNTYCINKDTSKCKKCNCWNCTRAINKGD